MVAPLRFSYDPAKAATNQKKHGITFAEAQTVFLDPNALTVSDDEHSTEEPREKTVGYSKQQRMLLVVHTERDGGVMRLISARRATSAEQRDYEEL